MGSALPRPFAALPTGGASSFAAKHATSRRAESFAGAAYDCRTRGWYSSVRAKRNVSEWSSIYRDMTIGEHAMALCSPLVSSSWKLRRRGGDGFLGVTCTGLVLKAVRDVFLQSQRWTDSITFAFELATGRMTSCSQPGNVDVRATQGCFNRTST